MVRMVAFPVCDVLQVKSLFFLGVVIVKEGRRRKGSLLRTLPDHWTRWLC